MSLTPRNGALQFFDDAAQALRIANRVYETGRIAYPAVKYAAGTAYNMTRSKAPRSRGPMIQPVRIVRKNQTSKRKARKPRTLKKKVRDIERKISNMTSVLTYKYLDARALKCTQNQTAYDTLAHGNAFILETALAETRFFDPSNPGTLIQASSATATYDRSYSIKNTSYFHFKNNYQVPVEVTLYKYKVKTDTNLDPYTAFTNGLTDTGGASASSVAVSPTDVSQVKDIMTLKSTTKWTMKPGDSRSFTINSKAFDYNPADYDAQSLAYQKGFDSQFLMVRIQGPPSHDKTTAAQIGTIAAGVDFVWKRTTVVRYNSGGPNLEYLVVNDLLDTQTAGPVVSQVVVDNQEYSTA